MCFRILNTGKVAENAVLLDSPPKPRPTITRAHNAPRPPPLSFTHQPVVPTHASPLHPPASPATEATTPGGGGFLSRLRRGRRNSGGGSGETDQLVKRNGQATGTVIKPAGSLASLRKCETVLALTSILRSSSSSSSIEPLQPQNRLRIAPEGSQSRLCSRCSSLLTLASGSRYSLDSAAGGFVRVPPTPDRLPPPILCKLCLVEVPAMSAVRIRQCECAFCSECMKAYVEFEISEGAYDISCPDAQCPAQGVLQQDEIKRLAGNDLLEKHKKYRLNREIELDKSRCWCPRAGCETVCSLCPSQPCSPQSVSCPTCSTDFCSSCKLEWHEGVTCEDHGKRLAKEGKAAPDAGIPFDSDLIKCCPMCGVPIEKDEGCAQMMCKRCKHVFCWYCLASLDDDFLLRHYDKGPCKNKLGHSRASVIWHRTQVIGIFAGFGILLLVASPLLLLAAPCIVCCKCRMCNAGTSKMDNEEDIQDES
ncbi:probable E3 ubiquitin-protein ligase RNF144A isoform X2 [Sitophilus oryzae]|uniref:E3 ubiquitin-protein ligase RNF144B n=1 Tax=Sitophilus oryzae TaxID=7048 RepID=A0A6J2XWF5_SITOR|nr:probable E3 ubiquitin-protein ligase RNF144A isoform X2 [Sitophilus oryzae]